MAEPMQLQPALAEVLTYDGPEQLAALSLDFMADAETPVSVLRKLLRQPAPAGAFLLESVQGTEQLARYSLVGVGQTQLEGQPGADPLAGLAAWLAARTVWARPGLPRFQGGAVGYLAFDAIAALEPKVPLPGRAGPDVPVSRWMLAEDVLVFDHRHQRLSIVTHMPLHGDRANAYAEAGARVRRLLGLLEQPLPPEAQWPLGPVPALDLPVRANRTRADFMSAVVEAQEAIAEGEVFQVVVSRRLTVDVALDPVTLYRALRTTSPSPYMFLLHWPDFSLVGASPEVLVRIEDGELLVRPIAGTRPRGKTAADDEALGAALLSDPKELAEHRMLVDLGRNDLGRVAVPGSIRVEHPEHLERFSHVQHIVTDVRGQLLPGLSALDALRASFPAGTVSGAPKVRACQLLARLEPDRRGTYAGAVGYVDLHGNLDTCIAIRTLLVQPDCVHLQTGAGIVLDSDPASEADECDNKARAGLAAIAVAVARGVRQREQEPA